MSSTPQTFTSIPAGKGATFTFVLGAFAAFAVLLSLFQAWKGEAPSDPRAADRLAFTAEIQKAQNVQQQ